MSWTLFGVASVFLLAVGLERHRRSREKWTGPNYTRQLREWSELEPPIKPLDLPLVKPLKAQKTERSNRVARFKGRADRG